MDTFTAEKLWHLLPHPSQNHVVRLFGRDKEGKVIGDFARNHWEIKRFADSCNGKYNCYVSPNPTLRMDGVRHSSEDVSHWSFFLIDIDPIEKIFDASAALIEVMSRVGGLMGRDLFKKEIPTILNSGRGYQIWMRGEDIEFSEKCTRVMSRKIMSYWLTRFSKRLGLMSGCRIDTSTSDLPRPMRLPGTINLKTGEEASFVEIQKHPFPWLFPFLISATPEEVLVEREIISNPGATWQKVFLRLTPTAQLYLIRGWEEPGRHKICFHTAKSLAEFGIIREETEKAIIRANTLRGEDQKLSMKDLQHCLDEAYKKGGINEESSQ